MLDACDEEAQQLRDAMRAEAADASEAAFARESGARVGRGGGGGRAADAASGSGEDTREEDATMDGGILAEPAATEARMVDRKRQLAGYREYGRRLFMMDRLALDVAMLDRARAMFAGARKRKREEDNVFPFKSAL